MQQKLRSNVRVAFISLSSKYSQILNCITSCIARSEYRELPPSAFAVVYSLARQPFNIPQYRFTPVIPDPRGVMLSPWDRAPQLRLADNNLSVSGYKVCNRD